MAATRDEGPRALGTKSYWDSHYARERENYVSSDGANLGVDWFSENIGDRLMRWLCEHAEINESGWIDLLDLGSGNGAFLFELEKERPWRGALVGIDYSEHAVELARAIAQHNGSLVDFRIGSVAALDKSLGAGETFSVVHDKGTFDAYMLSAAALLAVYRDAVLAALQPNGYFIITSCNYTVSELEQHFAGSESPSFSAVAHIPYPTFAYGGQSGSAVSTVAFKRVL